MNEHLEQYFYETYPELFQQHKLPMTQTCLCWGLDCGPGWFGIIDRACLNINIALKNDNKDKTTELSSVQFTQVKEKKGSLRIYWNPYYLDDFLDNTIDRIISNAENESWNTCESCGSTKGVRATIGWIKVRCWKCDRLENPEEDEEGELYDA